MVVDEEPAIRLLYRVNLEADGYEVLEAHSLASARAKLVDAQVDIVALDLGLYGERGQALVVKCQTRKPPIVVLDLAEIADGRELR